MSDSNKGAGEAVAWMLADAVGGSMLEFQRDLLLESQCRYGGEIVPLYTSQPVVAEAEAEAGTEVMRFQLKHPLTGETHTVEFTRAEVAEGMEDWLYEKLTPLVCNCDGEADHECGDYIHEFDMAPAAQPASGAVPEPENGLEIAAKFLEKRAQHYDEEHGSTDPETGTREYPGNGAEYYYELMEMADELRALLAKGVA